MAIEIDYPSEEFEPEDHERAVKWFEQNKQKLLECQEFIRNSPYKKELEAAFVMWDATQSKYWSETMLCIVRESGIYITSHGYGDPNEGKTVSFHIGEVHFEEILECPPQGVRSCSECPQNCPE